MSESDRLSPEVLANLRAIRAGEPWPHLDVSVPRFTAFPPNDLVPDSTWRLTAYGAAVLALADERDELRQRVADNDAHDAAWAAGAQAACARQPVQDCPYTDKALCKAWVSGYAHEGWIPGGVLAAEREAELQGKIEALRQRVAGFDRILTEPSVEQARLLALRETVDGLGRHVRGEMTADSARVDYWRQEILEAVIDTLPDVLDEAMVANLHRRLNKGVAGVLGLLEMQKDPKTGESYLPSWHDLPERVAALVREGEALREKVKSLTDERESLLAPVEGAGDDLGALVDMTCEDPKHNDLWCPTCEEYPRIRALAREVARLRAALSLADKQSAEAIERVSREIVADKWNSTAELQAEVKSLTAQVEEQRLTLLAEQGKPEGAPPGWSYEAGDPDFDEPGEWVHKKLRLKVWKSGTGWVWGRKERSGAFVGPKGQEDGQPARVVMLAAMAAASGGAR